MLPLDSPRWGELESHAASDSGAELPESLHRLASGDRGMVGMIWSALFQRGFKHVDAMYAVLPHLVMIAPSVKCMTHDDLLVLMAKIAAAERNGPPCPADLAPAFRIGVFEARRLILRHLVDSRHDVRNTENLLSALSSTHGHFEAGHKLRELIDGDVLCEQCADG